MNNSRILKIPLERYLIATVCYCAQVNVSRGTGRQQGQRDGQKGQSGTALQLFGQTLPRAECQDRELRAHSVHGAESDTRQLMSVILLHAKNV